MGCTAWSVALFKIGGIVRKRNNINDLGNLHRSKKMKNFVMKLWMKGVAVEDIEAAIDRKIKSEK